MVARRQADRRSPAARDQPKRSFEPTSGRGERPLQDDHLRRDAACRVTVPTGVVLRTHPGSPASPSFCTRMASSAVFLALRTRTARGATRRPGSSRTVETRCSTRRPEPLCPAPVIERSAGWRLPTLMTLATRHRTILADRRPSRSTSRSTTTTVIDPGCGKSGQCAAQAHQPAAAGSSSHRKPTQPAAGAYAAPAASTGSGSSTRQRAPGPRI